MDREEAKNILQLCCPGVEADRNDPLIAKALEVLKQDPELQIWFEDQQAFDSEFSAQIKSIEPPEGLKAAILAGMRAHQIEAESAAPLTEKSTTDFQAEQTNNRSELANEHSNSAWWRNPWVGIAALFVFMLVIIQAPSGNEDPQIAQKDPAISGLPPVLPFISKHIDEMSIFSFDKKSKEAHELQSYLASTGAPSPKNLVSVLADMPAAGCVTLEFNGREMSMICFKEGEIYHLITANAADFPDACPKNPAIYEHKDKAFKMWVEEGQLKIFTVHGTKKDIPEFI